MFYRIKQLILLSADIIMLNAGLYFGVAARNLSWPGGNLTGFFEPMIWLFTAAIIIFFIIGLYDIGRSRNTFKFFQKIIVSSAIWFMVAVFFFYTYPNRTVSPKTTLLLITIFGFGGVALWRAIYNRFLSANILRTPVVFVGFGPAVKELCETITKFPEHGYTLLGIISDEPISTTVPVEKSLNDLVAKNNGSHPGLVVISENAVNQTLLKELYLELFNQASIVTLADFYESFFKRIPPFTFSEDWFITNLSEQNRRIYDRFKVIVDYFFAILTGIVFVLSLPIVAVLLKITSPGPVFFSQKRIGRMGKEFTIYKYRTMKVLGAGGSAEKSGPQFASVNDDRVTYVGKLLRRTRLDEIPQFWNILRGEMSIIGPRPERPEFVKILTEQIPFYTLRHLVKPGITGWAQLQASYFGTIEENLQKLEYDLYYVKNRNLFLDSAIILKTFSVLLRFMGR
jgi:exopolysaccharide biosynthesis polyprenyl glycosylphosphotransferase